MALALSNQQTEIINDCIHQVRSEIFKIEDQTIALLSNLLTISRCLKPLLPTSFCHEPFPPLAQDVDDMFDLRSTIDKLARLCAEETQQRHSTRSKVDLDPSKLGNSARIQEVPESERFIPPPTTLKTVTCLVQQAQQTPSQIELGMLVLKKAEMMVRVEQLEGDMVFWTGVYEDIKGQQKRRDSELVVCACNTKQCSLHRVLENNDQMDLRAQPPIFKIPRKEVPIGDMLKRTWKIVVQREEKRDEEAEDHILAD